MPRRIWIALSLNALLFAALVLLAPAWDGLWAMRTIADLPWPVRLLLIALPLLALVPPLAHGASSAIQWGTTRLTQAPRPVKGALLAASGIFLWLLRERTLWGDALYTLALLEGRWRTTWRGEYFWKEPLDRLLAVATYQISHAIIGWDAWRAIALLSCLAGIAYIWIAWRLSGDLAGDATRRGLAFGMLLSPGAIQLLFGHVENYTLVTVAALGYVWLALRAIRGRTHPALASGILGLAIAFHPQAIFLIPSLAVLAWEGTDWQASLRRALWLAVGLAIPLLALLALARAVGAPPLQIGVNRYADDQQLWLSVGQMLSLGHLADVANNLYLVAPATSALILLLVAGWRPHKREDLLLATATLGVLAYSLAFANKLPRPDDWDLFAIAAVPVTVWVAQMAATAPLPIARRAGPALLAASLCFTVPWVWMNHAHERVDLNPAKRDLLTIYQVADLIARFPQAQIQQPPQPLCETKPGEDPSLCQYVSVTQFTMPQNGDTRPVLVIHPPAQVSYQVQLPNRPTFLWVSLAMDPITWGWGGDGATFVLTIDDGTGPAVILQRHVSNEPPDQRWHDVAVDLSRWRGRSVTLTFGTQPGPANNYVGDRAGWGMMWIMRGEPRLAAPD